MVVLGGLSIFSFPLRNVRGQSTVVTISYSTFLLFVSNGLEAAVRVGDVYVGCAAEHGGGMLLLFYFRQLWDLCRCLLLGWIFRVFLCHMICTRKI